MSSPRKRAKTCAELLDLIEPAWQLKVDHKDPDPTMLLVKIFGSSDNGLRKIQEKYSKTQDKPRKIRRDLGLEPNAFEREDRTKELAALREAWANEITARLARIA